MSYMDSDYYDGKIDVFVCERCGINWMVDDGYVETTKVSYCPNCGDPQDSQGVASKDRGLWV